MADLSELDKHAIAQFYAAYQLAPPSAQRGIYEQAITTGGGREGFNSDRLRHVGLGALAGVVIGAILFRG